MIMELKSKLNRLINYSIDNGIFIIKIKNNLFCILVGLMCNN